ncbi:hypothetical protein CTAYLR_000005 [Chrysophaeum taylorii]|uniref:VPS37 C-terminal domain-containing protein n=1 Tax=Chrysophaeum taylorii TaxID=2483200 RepID=A0AAD7UJ32_9STRA|nr:hypothetical protein CTAYLR_000005 [Chrysophaeum taylorii]
MWGNLNLFGRQVNDRANQIASLQKKVASAHVAAEDGSLIDVTFVSEGQEKRMRVFLPPRFPNDKPVLQLMQATQHPCVDKYNQVNVPYLAEWTSAHSSLAELVSSVVELLESGAEPARETPEQPEPAEPPAEEEVSVFETPMPEIPGSFGEVEAMSEEDAGKFLEDEAAFGDFFDSHVAAVKSMRELRDSLRSSNEKLAVDILKEREGFESTRGEALATRARLYDALDTYRVVQRRALELLPADDQAEALRAAQAKADLADTTSESLIDDFKNSTLSLPDWHRAYVDARVTHHTHAALAHILRQVGGDGNNRRRRRRN